MASEHIPTTVLHTCPGLQSHLHMLFDVTNNLVLLFLQDGYTAARVCNETFCNAEHITLVS